MVSEDKSNRAALPRPAALITFLLVLAVVSVAGGLAGGLVVLADHAGDGSIRPATVLWMLVCLAGSCCVAGVLWALAWLCRRQYHQVRAEEKIISTLEHLAGGPRTGAGPVQVPTAEPADAQDAILGQLRELNVNLLLSEDQRRLKARYLTESQAQELKQQLEELIQADNTDEAETLLDGLFRIMPDLPELPELRRRIEQARAEAQARDTASVSRQVEDFMAAGDFDQAQAAAEMLLARYPDLSGPAELVARVRREREAFVKEQRLRMYQKIEQEASARHWRSALAAAEELIEAHPDSTEADTVRAQMATLADNARIEEVRDLRDRIRDLIARRRYSQAVEIGRDVIKRFPQMAAAEELRRQMTRLEELAGAAGEDEQR